MYVMKVYMRNSKEKFTGLMLLVYPLPVSSFQDDQND